MDIGKQQRVIIVEPIDLTIDEELEELAWGLIRPGDATRPAGAQENASGDPLE